MLLGHARGKVGDLVFSRSNGQQITRARAAVVKNPRSEGQLVTRIILATCGLAYSKMKALVDHSFEGVKQGQDTMSAFMKANIAALRDRINTAIANGDDLDSVLSFAPLGSNMYAPNTYIIAKGQLPVVPVTIPSSNATVAQMQLATNTYQGVIDQFGLRRGDQLTFITLDNAVGEGNADFNYVRVILDPRNADGSEAPLSSPFVVDNAINLPSERNEGNFTSISHADNVVSFDLGAANQFLVGAAVIVSRKTTEGGWLRSNTQLVIDNASVNLYGGLSLAACLALAQGDGADFGSALYLNNAGASNVAQLGNGSATATPLEVTSEEVPLYGQFILAHGTRVGYVASPNEFIVAVAQSETGVPVNTYLDRASAGWLALQGFSLEKVGVIEGAEGASSSEAAAMLSGWAGVTVNPGRP